MKISDRLRRSGSEQLIDRSMRAVGLNSWRKALPPGQVFSHSAIIPVHFAMRSPMMRRRQIPSVFYITLTQERLSRQVHIINTRVLNNVSWYMHNGEQLIFEVQIFPLQLANKLGLDIPLTPRRLEVALGKLLSGISKKPLHSFYFILWKDIITNDFIQPPLIIIHPILPLYYLTQEEQLCSYYLSYKQNCMNHSAESTFTKAARSSLYNTTNQEYGTPWVQNNIRAERVDLKKDVVPTYSEIVGSLGDFKRAEKLIKSKVIRQNLQKEGVEANSENSRYQKKTEFHVTKGYSAYPDHGLNVGPATYQTNNMNYGNSRPADFQIQQKYFPCNSNFTKGFNGGSFKFNGLNTVKTVSQVHTFLNDM